MAERGKKKDEPVEEIEKLEKAQVMSAEIPTIQLPPGWDEDDGIEELQRLKAEKNREFELHYEVDGHPLDVLVNFNRALAAKFGWANMVPTPGFFSQPPTLVSVKTDLNEVTQVPFGMVKIPKLDGYLQTTIDGRVRPPKFVLTGKIRYKNKRVIDEIMDITRQLIKRQSIYRGKALEVSWQWHREGLAYQLTEHAPKFLDLSGAGVEDLILDQETMEQLDLALFIPIKYREALKANQIPIKDCAMLRGPYGTGKSLAAKVAGKLATEHGWTFILLKSIRDLDQALRFAEHYGPCLVAGEDIDTMVVHQNEMQISELTNLLDGVANKNQEVITILTTNDWDKLKEHGGMALLRPGRSTIIPILPPKAPEAARLVRVYGRGLFSPDADFARMGEDCKGLIASGIQKIVEDSKKAAIGRIQGPDIKGLVMEADVVKAAKKSRNFNDELVEKKKAVPRPFMEMVHEAYIDTAPAARGDGHGNDESDDDE